MFTHSVNTAIILTSLNSNDFMTISELHFTGQVNMSSSLAKKKRGKISCRWKYTPKMASLCGALKSMMNGLVTYEG